MHHNVMYGAPRSQIPDKMRSPSAQNQQSPLRPQGYFGFAPFHPQQGRQVIRRPESEEPEPSLSLSLEQPEYNVGMPPFSQRQQRRLSIPSSRIYQPSSQPPHTSAARTFDLEQPFQHAERPDQSMYTVPSACNTLEASQTQQLDDQPSSPQNEADGLQLQLVQAYESQPQDQSDEQQYPVPVATHDAVIQDKELFMTTLDNFLAALGTRLTVPNVGGKVMDVHGMYHEFTARGGLEQVIRHSQWKELIEVLGLSISSPSAFFFLRKHYTNLLFHYEQVYYHRKEGRLRSPPVPLPAPSPVLPVVDIGSPYEVPPEIGSALKKRKKKLDPMQVFGVDPAASLGTIVTGAIKGKFDEGYLVTVVVGTEKLTGVLYHVSPGNNSQQFASVPGLLDGVGTDWDVPGLEIQLGKKRKESLHKKDPNAPRRTRTGYNIFFKEQRARLRQLHPEKDKKLGKVVIEMWSRLPDDEKSLYVARGQQERERYKRELREYEERMRLQSQIDDGSHPGQPPAEHGHGAYDGSRDYHVSLDVEGDAMSFQGVQPELSDMGDLQRGQGYAVDEGGIGYHVSGSQSHIPHSEPSGGHLESEQTYEMQDGDSEYPEEAVSEEEGDPDMEEAYPLDEDETVYPSSEQGYEGQEDGSGYPVSDEAYYVQDESIYPPDVTKSQAQESEIHGGSVASEQPYYVQDHAYVYPSSLHQQQIPGSKGAGSLFSRGQVAYQYQDNGQAFHPHLQQSRPEAAANAVPHQHFYGGDGYLYAHVRQGRTVQAEALGVPVPSDQAAYHGQAEGLLYPPHLKHQNQAVEPSVQSRQASSEHAYQDRYPYPMPLPYTQGYPRPQAYPVRFPLAHTYPVHISDTQAVQYAHAIASHAHQPQALIPDVSGDMASSMQVYRVQDKGSAYHAQEDEQTVPAYKHGSYGDEV